ncbi:MAG TPA: hypothetical protein VEZ88_12995 [Steroidobacteraceae bacterium]|nr:hypothetical protein [Steroidobacteraceae bacterium]
MSTRQYSIFDTILARISRGSVPFDAIYWVDPQAERAADDAQRIDGDHAYRIKRQLGLQECATCD